MLELIRFLPLPSRKIVWRLITQVNDGYLAAYIIAFDPSRVNCWRFIPFLAYALVYPSIASNLVTLATLSTWSDSVGTYTCYTFSRKALLRQYRTVKLVYY